jgi:hypothetical protein
MNGPTSGSAADYQNYTAVAARSVLAESWRSRFWCRLRISVKPLQSMKFYLFKRLCIYILDGNGNLHIYSTLHGRCVNPRPRTVRLPLRLQ